MTHPHDEYGKRGEDGLKVTLPGGAALQARGPIVLTVILVTVAVFAVLYSLRDHDQGMKAQVSSATVDIKLMAERIAEVGYILTLTEAQRKDLRLDMPESLRRKTRESRDSR